MFISGPRLEPIKGKRGFLDFAGSPRGAHHGGATHSSGLTDLMRGTHIYIGITYKSKYYRISYITVTALNASVVYRYYIYSCRLSPPFIPPIRRYYSSSLLFRPIL